jgi:predicted amidohydrolase
MEDQMMMQTMRWNGVSDDELQINPFRMNPFREILAEIIESCSKSDADIKSDDDKYTSEEMNQMPITSIISELQFIAKQSDMWISGGGIHTAVKREGNGFQEVRFYPNGRGAYFVPQEGESTNDDAYPAEYIYNTHVIIDNEGNIANFYHKVHLFDVSIPGKVNLKESKTTLPGKKLVLCPSPIGKLGLTICYDMRFPEMYVELVQRGGAEVILIPSAFTVPTGAAHWHTLLRARAIESQCYVIAAAQVGQHNEKRRSYGHSLCYDPWGNLLVDAGGYDSENGGDDGDKLSPVEVPSISICDIDLDLVASVRERMPIQEHRSNSKFTFY